MIYFYLTNTVRSNYKFGLFNNNKLEINCMLPTEQLEEQSCIRRKMNVAYVHLNDKNQCTFGSDA